jgi:hypothetical protein
VSKLQFLLFAAALGGCGTTSPMGTGLDTQSAKLDSVGFDVPLSWQRSDTKTSRGPSATWIPEENTRKESLIVTRATVEPGCEVSNMQDLADLLVAAQHELPDSHISSSELFKTSSGMRGMRVEVSFVPFGMNTTYHRSHAVLFDGGHLIHVLYTAQLPDESYFDTLVRSVREEG